MIFPTIPIGAAFEIYNGATPFSDESRFWDGNIPWITPADLGKLKSNRIIHGKRFITKDGYNSCGTQIVCEGSIVLSIRAPIGHVAIAGNPLCFNQGCRGLTPRADLHSKYAYWALIAAKPGLEAAGQGTTFIELSRSKLKTIRISFPDYRSQKQIADFLDHETMLIDNLIEKKEKLIRLLNEKRNLQIYEIIKVLGCESQTKKINKANDLISRHFPQIISLPVSVLRLGLLAKIYSGGTPNKNRLDFWEGGEIPWIGSGAVNQFLVTQPTSYITNLAVSASSTKLMPKGSIIMALAGQGKTKGMVAQMGIDAYGNQSLACIYGYKGNNRFLLWWLKSLYSQVRSLSSQETRDGLNQTMLRQLPVPLINQEIQDSIAKKLDGEDKKINKIIILTKSSIEILKEFKASIITETVTGQLDIMKWKSRGNTNHYLDKIEKQIESKRSNA